MNENIDLTKILKGLEGIELWSPLCGKCKLSKIDTDPYYPIMINTLTNEDNERSLLNIVFTKEGHYHCLTVGGECLLFPSKDQRDWSKFERPIKEGTPVMCSFYRTTWNLFLYHKIKNGKHTVKGIDGEYYGAFDYIIRFKDFDPNDIEGSLKYNIQK